MSWVLAAVIAWAVLLVLLGVMIGRRAQTADRADEAARIATARSLAAEWGNRLMFGHRRSDTALVASSRGRPVAEPDAIAERSTGDRGD